LIAAAHVIKGHRIESHRRLRSLRWLLGTPGELHGIVDATAGRTRIATNGRPQQAEKAGGVPVGFGDAWTYQARPGKSLVTELSSRSRIGIFLMAAWRGP